MPTWNKRLETRLREAFADMETVHFQPIDDSASDSAQPMARDLGRHDITNGMLSYIMHSRPSGACVIRHAHKADPYIT